MIKEAIDKVIDLAAPNLMRINDSDYSDKKLLRIDKECRATSIQLTTLTSLVDYIKGMESDFKRSAYAIIVESPISVALQSALDTDRKRETLVECKAQIPVFDFGRFIENEKFIINMQSKFIDNDDKKILLQFAGGVKTGTIAEYGDSGVGQKATIKKGVSSLMEVEVPSPCQLKPYRSFAEVEQPTSQFIFRVKDGGFGVECALFEADGGAWKNEAMKNIKTYLQEELKEFKNIIILA